MELGRAAAAGGDGAGGSEPDTGEALRRALRVDGGGEVPPGVVAASTPEDPAADLHQTVAVAGEAVDLAGVAVVAVGVFPEAELAPGVFRGAVVAGVHAQAVVPARGLAGRGPSDHRLGLAEPPIVGRRPGGRRPRQYQ